VARGAAKVLMVMKTEAAPAHSSRPKLICNTMATRNAAQDARGGCIPEIWMDAERQAWTV
jgi:hypothetical protein